MNLSLCYWILMLFALVWGLYSGWPLGARGLASPVLLFLLLLIIGWQVFGAPLHK